MDNWPSVWMVSHTGKAATPPLSGSHLERDLEVARPYGLSKKDPWMMEHLLGRMLPGRRIDDRFVGPPCIKFRADGPTIDMTGQPHVRVEPCEGDPVFQKAQSLGACVCKHDFEPGLGQREGDRFAVNRIFLDNEDGRTIHNSTHENALIKILPARAAPALYGIVRI